MTSDIGTAVPGQILAVKPLGHRQQAVRLGTPEFHINMV